MTIQMSIMNHSLAPDDGVYFSKLSSELTLTNAKEQMCVVMPAPSGSDIGLEAQFTVPQNYASAPVLVAKGVIDGSPANTFAVAAQQLSRADSEAVDTAYETEDTATNATWTGYADEDMYEITITLTPASAYVAGDTVFVWFYRDDSADTTSWALLLTDLLFQYTES
jgi:hypothetical protein